MKQFLSKMWNAARNPVGRAMMVCAALLAFTATTSVARADDISTLTSTVSGYVTAAIAVGVAVILFVLGRKVLRRLVCVAFGLTLFGLAASAQASPMFATADDITTVTTSVSGYVTAAIAVGVAVVLFVLGRKVLRKLV